MNRRRFCASLLLCLMLLSVAACEGKAEKEAKYIGRGNALFEKKDYEKAKLEYKNALRIDPTGAEPYYRLALTDEALGDLRNAFAGFMKAEQQQADYVPALLKIAQYMMAAEQYPEAQNRLDKVFAKDPGNAEAFALQAALDLRLQKYDETEKKARLALEKDPANLTAFSVLTGLYEAQNKPAEAVATIEEGVKKNPQSLAMLILKAMVYEKTGNIDKVTEAFQSIFKLEPNKPAFRSNLAQIYQKAGLADRAEATLRAGVAAMPKNNEMKRRLVDFLDDTKGIEAAEGEIRAAMKADPSNEAYMFWLADLSIKHKDIDRAIALLEQMVAKDDESLPDALNARTSLARIHLIRGDKALAEKLIATVLEKDPNNPTALLLRAQLAYENGDYQSAISNLRSIVRDHPQSTPALRLLAEALLTQGYTDLAIDTLRQLIDAAPTDVVAQVRLAQLMNVKGNTAQAMSLLETVNKARPDFAIGWENTARVALSAQKWEEAQAAIASLEKIEGQKETALFLQAQMESATGKPDEALAHLKDVVRADPASPLAEHALSALVDLAFKQNSLPDALSFMAGLSPQTPFLLTLKGECALKIGQKDEAIAALDQALAQNPALQAPYLDRAKLYLASGDTEKALALLDRASLADPADLRAPLMKADILSLNPSRIKDAIALYAYILDRSPKTDAAANNMAQLIADYQSDDKDAMEKARVAAERFISSSNPFLLDTLAWVYFKSGNVDQAQTIMQRIEAFGDKLPPQIQYHRGALLLKQGRKNEAKAALEKATQKVAPYPGLEEARKLLKDL